MNDWTLYQTDYLFLLIGTNPLPNYVAALLLAKDDSKVYLLHSGGAYGTGEVADRLKHAIQDRRSQLKVIPREIDEANGSRIVQKMGKILDELSSGASVGLHYTGGTKAMAVHVYRAVEKVSHDGVFSYLDARTLSLMIDGRDGKPTVQLPVGQACPIKLQDLLELHGRPTSKPVKDTVLPERCKSLGQLHSQEPKLWREWCNSRLRRPDNQSKFRSKTDLKPVQLPGQIAGMPVFGGLPEQADLRTLEDMASFLGWKVNAVAKWLDGKWLEHHVLNAVKQIAPSCDLHDYGMNLELSAEGQQFEFDVAAMRGYQLFALSCTTSDAKGLCKHKLFEAYVRARQMGGDEARIGLVCCFSDPEALRQEVEEVWFTEGRVRVFGKKDLLDLPAKLQTWFETANDQHIV